jgi:hypothetical protein
MSRNGIPMFGDRPNGTYKRVSLSDVSRPGDSSESITLPATPESAAYFSRLMQEEPWMFSEPDKDGWVTYGKQQ